MSIGIYMPAHNVEKYILESLNSIKSQTYNDWELVIIDDASTDNTYDVIKNILNTTVHKDDRIKLFKREEHCGRIGQVKNECISKFEKSHDYICHVGSDDIISNNCFEIFITYMDANNNIGACCGSFVCFDDSGKQWSFPHVTNSNNFDRRILLQYMCLFPMRFYRKSIVDSVGGYSNELTSAVDYDLALRLDEVTTMHRIKNPITYYYRQHGDQVSTKSRQEQDLNAKKALQNALIRRGINGFVENDKPPFRIRLINFWGAK